MSALRQILERRIQLRSELASIYEAHPDGAELPAEIQTRAVEIEAEGGRLDEAERRQAVLDDLARRAPGTPANGRETRGTVRVNGRDAVLPESFDGRVLTTQSGDRVPVLEARHRLADFAPVEDRGISFGGFLRALYLGPQTDIERRALAEASIGTGGALVPSPLSLQVIDLLRSQVVAFRAGAGTIPMDSQTLRFARVIADPIGGWRAEAAPIVEGAPAFDAVTLTAKNWTLLVKISRELLEDGQNTDTVLQNIFARTAALALDRAILYGDGTNNSPIGISNTPGIQVSSLGVNGGQLISRGPLLDAVEALELANTRNITAAVMSPRSSRALNGLVDSLGQPLRPPPSLENLPMLTTTSASVAETQGTSSTASSILIGDFSQVYVGLRTALQVSVLQERYADTGQVGFILWMRGDVLVQHPAAMARIEGVTP